MQQTTKNLNQNVIIDTPVENILHKYQNQNYENQNFNIISTKGKILNQKTNYAKGCVGEEVASLYLKNINYNIITRRFKSQYGEIDIIAEYIGNYNQKTLIFIEIKHRKINSAAVKNMELVSKKQIKRSYDTASCFLVANEALYGNHTCRFDVIVVDSKTILNHVKDAWDYI